MIRLVSTPKDVVAHQVLPDNIEQFCKETGADFHIHSEENKRFIRNDFTIFATDGMTLTGKWGSWVVMYPDTPTVLLTDETVKSHFHMGYNGEGADEAYEK